MSPILERLSCSWVEPIVDPLLPHEQASFQNGRSTVDQVTQLTQANQDCFSAKKTEAVFVCHRGLTCKLLWLLPDRHIVRMIMEIVGYRRFTLEMANRAGYNASWVVSYRDLSWHPFFSTRLWPANPRLQKVCICWVTDDSAIMHAVGVTDSGRGAEQGHDNHWWIPPDLEAKTQHHKNGVGSLKEAKRELKVNYNNEVLPFCAEPKFLEVTLGRSPMYRGHLESFCKKLTSRQGCQFGFFWNQILKFWLVLNTFDFFWKYKKARQNLAFFNQKGLALEKHCLSCIFITNLFWKESITMQGAQNSENILLLP